MLTLKKPGFGSRSVVTSQAGCESLSGSVLTLKAGSGSILRPIRIRDTALSVPVPLYIFLWISFFFD